MRGPICLLPPTSTNLDNGSWEPNSAFPFLAYRLSHFLDFLKMDREFPYIGWHCLLPSPPTHFVTVVPATATAGFVANRRVAVSLMNLAVQSYSKNQRKKKMRHSRLLLMAAVFAIRN